MSDPSSEQVRRALDATSAAENPADALVICDWALERGDQRLAASALDRAFGLRPVDARVAQHRAAVLDALSIEEHGILFRYVPAGAFLMGSTTGEPDERPVHAATTGAYWLSETPVTWAAYCHLMGWMPPPQGRPDEDIDQFMLAEENKIRFQYCESETEGARDWHAHVPGESRFGAVPRSSARPHAYDQKPMVAIGWHDAVALGERLSAPTIEYRLPTEAEWEKAARGGLIGARWSWGGVRPDRARCDFGHFGEFVIRPPRSLPPNDYGLFGMCGGVSEWTADEYDALAYRADRPALSKEARPKVLRGGSWADCADAVTVSFRASRAAHSWRQDRWGAGISPTIGFRLCRAERAG